MDLACALCQLYLVVSKKVSKLRISDTDSACIEDGPKYEPTLDLASHFFALAFSAPGVIQNYENVTSLIAVLLKKIFQYGSCHLLHLVDGS